jgi:hypothetical protein
MTVFSLAGQFSLGGSTIDWPGWACLSHQRLGFVIVSVADGLVICAVCADVVN